MIRFGKEELDLLTRVARSGMWFRYVQEPFRRYGRALFTLAGKRGHYRAVEKFEEKISGVTGIPHVLAVSSGTGAIVSSLAALGVGAGDEVLVPGYTYLSSATACIALGAVPVIVEIDETLTMDTDDLERKITARTKAVMPVHMCGYPCDMDSIMRIAGKHNLKVVEDAAQAVGGRYHGAALGGIGDIGCFSFQFHKIISTGEGGAVLTRDPVLLERAAMYHDSVQSFMDTDGGVKAFPGINFRMHELSGAVGCAQADRLKTLVRDLRKTKKELTGLLGDIGDFSIVTPYDEKGDLGSTLTIQAPDAQRSRQFTQKTGVSSLFSKNEVNWHVYYYWDCILEKRSHADNGWPWKFGDWESEVRYSKDMCPHSLDILGRSFNFSISPDCGPAALNKTADIIRKGCTG